SIVSTSWCQDHVLPAVAFVAGGDEFLHLSRAQLIQEARLSVESFQKCRPHGRHNGNQLALRDGADLGYDRLQQEVRFGIDSSTRFWYQLCLYRKFGPRAKGECRFTTKQLMASWFCVKDAVFLSIQPHGLSLEVRERDRLGNSSTFT